jgi:hypothetical protein
VNTTADTKEKIIFSLYRKIKDFSLTAETIAHEFKKTGGFLDAKKCFWHLFSTRETDSAGVPERSKGHGLGPCA